jgi:hypothetical protein
LARKSIAAIDARLTALEGQWLPAPKPEVICSARSCSIPAAPNDPAETSLNAVAVAAGGVQEDPYFPRRRKIAIWSRVTMCSEQSIPAPHPAVAPARKSDGANRPGEIAAGH